MFGMLKSNICSGVILDGTTIHDHVCSISKEFHSKEACHDHLFQLKWPEGFRCPLCQHATCYITQTRRLPLYECKACRYQTTVTAGTLFEKTRTPLHLWFAAVFFMSHDKRGMSATLLSQELEISYQTAWTMMHKMRKAMAQRDAEYGLSGLVELDDFYIGASTENGKRGRGTDKNQVLVAMSKNEKGHPLFVKMEVIENMKKETVESFVTTRIDHQSTLIADGHRTIPTLQDQYQIEAKPFDAKEDPEHLRWIHTIFPN